MTAGVGMEAARPSRALLLRRGAAYLALMRISAYRVLAYRGRYLVALLTALIEICVLFFLWRALYHSEGGVAGYGWDELRTYLFITYLMQMSVTLRTEYELSRLIRDGSIVIPLSRPVDFQWACLAEAAGSTFVEVFALGGIVAVAVAILFSVQLPSPAGLAAFAVAFGLGFLIRFLLAYLTGLLCFWTTSVLGLIWARNTLTFFFSGALVPLEFFPGWLRQLALALPFQGALYTPANIYLGRLAGPELFGALGLQLFWVLVLWHGARAIYRRGLARLTQAGG